MRRIPALRSALQAGVTAFGLTAAAAMAPGAAHAQDDVPQRCSILHIDDAHGVGARDIAGHCHWTLMGAELANERIRRSRSQVADSSQATGSGVAAVARKLMNQHGYITNPGPGPIAAAQRRDEDKCREVLAGIGEDASQCSDPGQAAAVTATRTLPNIAMNGLPVAGAVADPGRTGCHKLLDSLPRIGQIARAYHTYEDYHDALRPPPDPAPTPGATAAFDCR